VRACLRMVCIGVLTVAAMTGCTMKNANVPPDELMRQFQAGQPMLDCSMEECGLGWMQNRQKAELLEATGRWQELALFVMQIGFMDDLTYYYLGRAAQELGYLQAAQRYYRIAERLSVTELACGNRPHNICNGHVFPDQLYPHLEVVEARLAAISAPSEAPDQTRTRRVVRRQVPQASTSRSAPPTGQGATPASAAGSSPAPSSGFVEPAPAAASSSTDFFEPPPVRR
jgi:hypothetical protein